MFSPYITAFPEYGYAKATNFSFKLDQSTLDKYDYFLWNFGDETFSKNPNPSHTYKLPNTYKVQLNAFLPNGEFESFEYEVDVKLYLNESIYFDSVPPPTFASHYNKYPFKLKITSASTGKHTIDLSTQFSKSYKHQNPRNKWSFLRPEWRFLDLNGNVIESIDTIDTPIKIDQYGNLDQSGITVGVTGFAEFYLIDDLYNTDYIAENLPYTTIIATLQTSALNSFKDTLHADELMPSFSNSNATAIMPHSFIWRYPSYIDISENGIKGIVKNRWSNSKHPILVKYCFDENPDFDDNLGNGVKLYNPDVNFCHYIPFDEGDLEKINININGISSYIIPSPTEISYYGDDSGYLTSGYYKGTYYTENVSAKNVELEVTSLVKTPTAFESNFFNPILWVSNPEAGMAATVYYFYNNWQDNISTKNLNKAYVKSFDIPIVKPILNYEFFADSHPLSGYHGVYSIAALPPPHYQAWMCDSEKNYLYRISTLGEILCSIDLVNLFYRNDFTFTTKKQVFGVVSPASITLDSNLNLWVSLYDSISALKFDKNGTFLFATSPINSLSYSVHTNSQQYSGLFLDNSRINHNNINFDLNLIEPTGIDTDIHDNVWISYSNVLSGMIIKYDTNGNLLKTISYPVCSCPQELMCDSEGNVWVVGGRFSIEHELVPPNTSEITSGFLEKRDTNGNILSSFGPFFGIQHLTLDQFDNPWFTHSYQWVGRVDNETGYCSYKKIETGGYSDKLPEDFDPLNNTDETALEGITTDLIGNVYVINSIENKIIVLKYSEKNISIIDNFNINPKGFSYYNDESEEKGYTKIEFNYWSKSAQAQGDWSGSRWIKKYGIDNLPFLYNPSGTLFLSGKADGLNFYDKNPYDFFEKNENFDLSKKIKEFSFQPTLENSKNLYDNFFSDIFGKYPFNHDDLGISSFEKLSNFVSNHNDVDTCDIESLYDLSRSFDMDYDDFKIAFPLQVKRLINNLSINQSKLWGSETNDIYNFKNINDNNNFNRGYLITSDSYMISAGVPVILKTKSLNDYKLINTGYYYDPNISLTNAVLVGLSTYPISSLCEFLNLGSNWKAYYEFYEFLPSDNKIYVDGVIDWTNDQTVLNMNLSSGKEWTNDEGILDTLFSYELYKGLGLI